MGHGRLTGLQPRWGPPNGFIGFAERHTSIVTKSVRKKKLVAIGNSLAFFVDQPFRRMLGITANTLLDVTTDGRRLIIEPAGQRDDDDGEKKATMPRRPPPKEVTVAFRALDVFKSLLHDHGLTQEHYLRLKSSGGLKRHWTVWYEWLQGPRAHELDPEMLLRFERCWEALESGSDWESAIQTAVAAFPVEGKLRSDAGVGKPVLDAGQLATRLDPDLEDVAEL